MQNTALVSEFLGILRPHLKFLSPTKELDMDLDLSSVGLDSIGAVDMLLKLEEYFQITFTDDLLIDETFATARALWSVIDELRDQR